MADHEPTTAATSTGRTDSLGRDIGHWIEDYRCKHCGGAVVVRLYAAWPEKCPRCGVWSPVLEVKTDAQV